jgi:hypothetical protein
LRRAGRRTDITYGRANVSGLKHHFEAGLKKVFAKRNSHERNNTHVRIYLSIRKCTLTRSQVSRRCAARSGPLLPPESRRSHAHCLRHPPGEITHPDCQGSSTILFPECIRFIHLTDIEKAKALPGLPPGRSRIPASSATCALLAGRNRDHCRRCEFQPEALRM